MASDFLVREYQKADWPMVNAWWNAHTQHRILVEAMLPPVGVVVERDGAGYVALWCHLSAGVGVAFLENPVSRPLASHAEVEAAFDVAIKAIEAICKTHDYGLLVVNTLPAIARWLTRHHGFQESGLRVQMTKFLNHGT